MKVRAVFAVVLLSLSLTLVALSQTQITTGAIQGTVTDPSGAVVPGAEVVIQNLDTNLTKTLSSDSDGRFIGLQLPPGRYKVTIHKAGFASLVQENLVLRSARR